MESKNKGTNGTDEEAAIKPKAVEDLFANAKVEIERGSTTSERKSAANKRNSKESTGPKTPI